MKIFISAIHFSIQEELLHDLTQLL